MPRLANAPLAAAVAALALAAAPACARAAEPDRGRHPLLPDHAKLQFAGAIGFLSAGPGYDFARRRLELDALLGWVPEQFTTRHLVTFTGKLTYLPWRIELPRDWALRPLTASTALTYTFGDRFHLQSPAPYPSEYHPLPTAVRASFSVGGTIGRAVGRLRSLGVAWEIVAVDIPLVFWFRDREVVRGSDVLSLALGLRAEF